MRSITLSFSESVLLRRANSLQSSFSSSKPLKIFHFFANLNVSRRNSARILSRQCSNKNCDRLFTQSWHSESDKLDNNDFKLFYPSSYSATKMIDNLHECSISERSILDIKLPVEKGMSAKGSFSDTSLHNYLKFVLLIGFFTLQDTQDAVAASDFASGLESSPFFGDLSDLSTGFASAFLLIFFSELGDKTFFIAALLAARNSAAVVFLGTFGALGVMSVISVVLGRTFHFVDDILPFRFGDTDLPLDDIAAVFLLVYFGVSTLLEASSGDGLKAEEEQKEAELAVSEFSGDGAGILAAASTVVSTFVLVFVAEWGDKSFFSTIALSASSSPLGVIGGALAGHGFATLHAAGCSGRLRIGNILI